VVTLRDTTPDLFHAIDNPLLGIPVTGCAGNDTCWSTSAPPGASQSEMQAHPCGRFVLAANNDYLIPHQGTDLVAEEILGIVRTVRQDKGRALAAGKISGFRGI
jgi:hypothetical protein